MNIQPTDYHRRILKNNKKTVSPMINFLLLHRTKRLLVNLIEK